MNFVRFVKEVGCFLKVLFKKKIKKISMVKFIFWKGVFGRDKEIRGGY